MSRIINYYTKALHVLEKLHTDAPTIPLGKHLATALDESGNLFTLTDKEIYEALKNYAGNLEYDVPHIAETDIDKIINDGKHLHSILDDDFFNEDE